MQLGRTTPKGWLCEECRGQSSKPLRYAIGQRRYRFYVGCHILYFSFVKILFVGCIAQMGVANNQNSKKILRTDVLFANFYVYLFLYEFDG